MPPCPANPSVSVLIPTYNRAHLLPQAIESVLAQTYSDFEIIVSDNASTDATPTVLAACTDPRVIKVRQDPPIPPIENINACLRESRGAYFLVLSDDDWLDPTCLEQLVGLLALHPSATIAYGRTRKETIEGQLIAITRPSPLAVEPGLDYVWEWIGGWRETAFCCTIFRTDCVRQIGGFPPFAPGDCAVRAAVALMGDVVHVPRVLANYRVHQKSDSYSFSVDAWYQENAKMVNYLCAHFPAELQKRFKAKGEAYALKSQGVRIGEAISMGFPRYAAWGYFFRYARNYGLRFFSDWPWRAFLAKILLPTNMIDILRKLRNKYFSN